MKKLLLVLLSCVALFAEEIKEYEYALPFEMEVVLKDGGESYTQQIAGALLQLRSGEIVVASSFSNTLLEFENPFYLVRDEDFFEDVSLRRLRDGVEFAEGQQVGVVTGEKILRRVVYIDDDQILFDDSYVIYKLSDVEFPHYFTLDTENTQISLEMFSMYPLILNGQVITSEFIGKIAVDCTDGCNANIEVSGIQSDPATIQFRSGSEFKTAIGLGEYHVGDLFYFTPILITEDLFKQFLEQDLLLEDEAFLIHKIL